MIGNKNVPVVVTALRANPKEEEQLSNDKPEVAMD